MHSTVVGGSNAKRVLACPGSIDLNAKVPRSPSSSYAEEGTALHSAMEYLLDPAKKRVPKAEDVLGLVFNKHTMTEALVRDAVAPGLEYFHKVIGRHKMPYELEVSAPFPALEGAFGTTDIVAFPSKAENLIVFDWKFGTGVKVFAEMNEQMMFYACCVLEARKLWRTVKIIDMHICQPRVDHYDRCVISIQQLRAFRHALIRAVNGPRNLATGDHCRWCDAAAFCPAKQEEARLALAWHQFAKDLPAAMAMVPLLKDWCAAVETATYGALSAGVPVPGYKLVDRRATRKWAVDDTAVRAYLAQYGLTEDQIAPRETVSPAQAEKLLKPHGEKLDVKKVKAESSGYTVAPESSDKPNVSTGRNINDLASYLNGSGGLTQNG